MRPRTEKPPPATDDAKQREIAAHLVVVDSLGRIDYVANGLARPCSVRRRWNCTGIQVEGVVETICGRPIPVETLFTRFANAFVARSSRPKDILFYFNGGMNATSDVIKQANDQYGAIQRDGYFPIFMAWPTGAVEKSTPSQFIKLPMAFPPRHQPRSRAQVEWSATFWWARLERQEIGPTTSSVSKI